MYYERVNYALLETYGGTMEAKRDEEFTSINKYIRRGEANVTQVTENKGTIEERDSRTNKDLSTNSTVAVFALIRIISLLNSPPPHRLHYLWTIFEQQNLFKSIADFICLFSTGNKQQH